MDKKRFFLNPPSKSPWQNEAPKTNSYKKKHTVINDENNNNFRSPQVTKYIFRPDLQYRNIGFFAHSGQFHSYYQSAKQDLLVKEFEGYKSWAMAAQRARVNPRRVFREVETAREPLEVIDITEDSPPATPKNSTSLPESSNRVPKPLKVPTRRFVKIRPKTDPTDEEGLRPKDTIQPAVGVVITKKSTGYVARLL